MLRLMVLIVLSVAAAAAEGRLWLKDAANGDARVGPNAQDGIPQGHALKVAVGGVKVGHASGTELTVVLADASRDLASAALVLDGTGYGETRFPIAMPPGVYQIRLGNPQERGRETGLGGPFRVVEAAPPMNLPFGAPAVIAVVGAALLGLSAAWRRARIR